MSNLLLQAIEKKFINKKVPIIRPGYQVRVHQKIKEGNKERIQVFEGMVVSMNAGHGSSKTFTVRKVVQGIGVEKIFPVYSPRIAKIDIKKTFKTRRAKLNYLRDATGVSKRLSAKLGLIEKDELLKEKKGLTEEQEATVDEAVKKAEPEEQVKEASQEGAETKTPEAQKEKTPEVKQEAKAEEVATAAPSTKEEAPKEEPKQEKSEETVEAKPEEAHVETEAELQEKNNTQVDAPKEEDAEKPEENKENPVDEENKDT